MRWITYSFSNFNGTAVDVWNPLSNFIPHYCACDYLSILWLQIIHVSKKKGSLLANDQTTTKHKPCVLRGIY